MQATLLMRNIRKSTRIKDIGWFAISCLFGFISSIFNCWLCGAVTCFQNTGRYFSKQLVCFIDFNRIVILVVMRTQRPFFKSKPASILSYTAMGVGIAAWSLITYLPFSSIKYWTDSTDDTIDVLPLRLYRCYRNC